MKKFINTSVIYPPLDDEAALLKAAKLPPSGRVASTVMARTLASRKGRSLAVSRSVDGPEALRKARRREQAAAV